MLIELIPFEEKYRDLFVKDLQEAFQLGFIEKYNITEEVISKKEINESIDAPNSHTYHIVHDKKIIGGVIVTINKSNHNELDLFYIKVGSHGGGIGQKVWKMIEKNILKH